MNNHKPPGKDTSQKESKRYRHHPGSKGEKELKKPADLSQHKSLKHLPAALLRENIGTFLSMKELGRLAQVDRLTSKDLLPHTKKRTLDYLKKLRSFLVAEKIADETNLPGMPQENNDTYIKNSIQFHLKKYKKKMSEKLARMIIATETMTISSQLSDLITFV